MSDPFGGKRFRKTRFTPKTTKTKPPAPSPAVIPRGPAQFRGSDQAQSSTGPGNPPEGFVGGSNSLTEWYIYWASEKLLGPEGVMWEYQTARLGGRNMPGGAVLDFMYWQENQRIGVRVVTYYWHLTAPAEKRASDDEQLVALMADGVIIIDIYDQYFIHDETGNAAIAIVKEALNGIQRPNPIVYGVVNEQRIAR